MATITLALDSGASRVITTSDTNMLRVLDAVWQNYKRDANGQVPAGTLAQKADFYKEYLVRISRQELKAYEAQQAGVAARQAVEGEIDALAMT